MVHFSYCFCLTLMHSLWQAALLLCMYASFNTLIKKNSPVIKRNILYGLLLAQLLLSISTFFIYSTGQVLYYTDLIATNFSGIFTGIPWLEKAAPWLIGAYMAILLYKSGLLIFNWMRFKANTKTSRIKPSIDLKLFTRLKSFEFGIRRKVELWYSSNISTPMTFGFFKPVILLPIALLNNLSLEETETLIIHELTHIKNNDYFLNWLLVACETVFFFNPFIQMIGNSVRLEREKNCDTHVLQFNYPAISYAETLLKVASFKTTPAPFFLAAALKNTQLFKRIRFFTKEKNLWFYKRNYTGLAIALIVMVIVVNLFLLNIIKHEENNSSATAPVIASYPADLLNEKFIDQFSTAVIPLIEKATQIAEKASKEARKENLNAIAAKELAELEAEKAAAYEPEPESIAVPIALTENDDTKEVTLKEESSATGKSVTKVYKMKLVNGKWKTVLLWTITETRPSNDSGLIVKDTTHYYNRVQ